MSFLYHGVSDAMDGVTLHPLNVLRDRAPGIHAREIAKYVGNPHREALPATVIPRLDCLWGDVVFLAPIHPHRLFTAWVAAGAKPNPDWAFFRIPLDRIAHAQVVTMIGREVTPFDPATYRELTTVPDETHAWYAKLAAQGRRGGDFVGVPHVLVRGSIDITGVEIIRWGDSPTGDGAED